ncbi:MAG: site-specific integrase [Nitrospirota bacterium]|jgi:integrase
MGLYKRKGSRFYWMSFRVDGKRIYESTRTSNKKLAEKRYARRLIEIEEGYWFQEPTILFREAWEKYMREEAEYNAPGTRMRAEQSARNFLPVLGDLALSRVTPAVLSSYKATRLKDGVCISTVIKELQFVRRVFSLCKREWLYVRQSPFEFFRMPADNTHRVRILEPGQFEALVAACPSWLRPIVILARYTGMRRGNVLGLTWGQIDFSNRLINLDMTKNGQRLSVPLTETPYGVLVEIKSSKVVRLNCPYVFHERGKPVSPHKVTTAFRRACRRAGVENFRFHDLRHDFASRLVQGGNDLYIVQNLLGHKDGRMTQRYAHLRVEHLRRALDVLEGGDILVTVGSKKGLHEL